MGYDDRDYYRDDGRHRPRLAIVISIVISIAGVIALGALPVAQFPDIVPQQVGVSATYPGASAAAVEESVAQVIEAQVNGVDKMIYMKSTSGSDGSYSLNVSFQVGSDLAGWLSFQPLFDWIVRREPDLLD